MWHVFFWKRENTVRKIIFLEEPHKRFSAQGTFGAAVSIVLPKTSRKKGRVSLLKKFLKVRV
eukprot:m.227928 g.227928  ORF g.227928 m.227928 type:complete len:62 (+) comp40041_c0_seq53:4063-4248(+)